MSVKQTKRTAPQTRKSAKGLAPRKRAAETLAPPAYFRWKAVIDRVLAVVLLVPGLPLIALLVLLVRLTSRGPGIYCQIRVGRDGRKFKIYKIRTMRHDAESGTGPVWTQTARDPRITSVGRILRRFHLDELPQLLNIVKGEMSIVGPRPERPEFVHVLAEAIPNYHQRVVVRPGVTGLAQLNLPPDSDLNSVRRKLALDCEYIRHAGPWLDARIFVCTGLRMVKISGSWLLRSFGLRRTVVLQELPEPRACVSGGNGNGRGNGSNPAPTTPTKIFHEAAAESIENDKRLVKEAHPRHASIKPR